MKRTICTCILVCLFVGMVGSAGANAVEVRPRATEAPPGDAVRSSGGDRDVAVAESEVWNSMEPEQWLLAREILELDDAQWAILERVLRLDAAELKRLDDLLNLQGAARITTNGRVLPISDPVRDDEDAIVVPNLSIRTLVDRVLNGINELTSRIPQNLKARLPDRPEFRDLIQSIHVGQLGDFLSFVSGQLQGMLDYLGQLRMRWNEFAPNGSCDAGACAQFKTSLRRVTDDVRTAALLLQGLRCVDNPDARLLSEFDTGLFTTLLDKSPTFVLYGMWLVLSQEQFSGWDTAVGEVVAAFPVELLDLCDEEALRVLPADLVQRHTTAENRALTTASCGLPTHEELICSIQSAFPDSRVLPTLSDFLAASITGLDLWLPWIPKDFQLTIAGMVVGGGGGGTKVENPAKSFIENIKTLLTAAKSDVDDLAGLRAECRATESAIESDLRACTPPRSIFLGGLSLRRSPTLRAVARSLDLMIKDAEDVGMDVTDARGKLDAACALDPTVPENAASAYAMMCEAYDDLIPFDAVQRAVRTRR